MTPQTFTVTVRDPKGTTFITYINARTRFEAITIAERRFGLGWVVIDAR